MLRTEQVTFSKKKQKFKQNWRVISFKLLNENKWMAHVGGSEDADVKFHPAAAIRCIFESIQTFLVWYLIFFSSLFLMMKDFFWPVGGLWSFFARRRVSGSSWMWDRLENWDWGGWHTLVFFSTALAVAPSGQAVLLCRHSYACIHHLREAIRLFATRTTRRPLWFRCKSRRH